MVRLLNTKSGTEIEMSETSWSLCEVGSPHLKLIEDVPDLSGVQTNFITVSEVKTTASKAEFQKPEQPKPKPSAQKPKRIRKATTKKKEVKNDTGK